MASVSLAVPTVGPADNRTVTIVATPGAPSVASKPVEIYWTVVQSTIPAGFRGGRGPATLVFAPGTFDPGTYNVRCLVYDPGNDTTAEASRTFNIPKADPHLMPLPTA
jgi:hypothetical protein